MDITDEEKISKNHGFSHVIDWKYIPLKNYIENALDGHKSL